MIRNQMSSTAVRNQSMPWHESEMIKYGPYYLIPVATDRVAIHGAKVVNLNTLHLMARKNKFTITLPSRPRK